MIDVERDDPQTRGSTAPDRSTLRAHWPLALVLAYSAAIGFWSLARRGYVFIDEGYQHLESVWVKGKLSYALAHAGAFDMKRFVLGEGGGIPLAYGKPAHSLFDALALGLLPGSGAVPVLVLQGLFGLGTIALVYFIALRLSGRRAAIASAAILGSSAYLLAYRRSGLPEADSIFFFTLALWALVVYSDRGPLTARRMLVIGSLGGLCFTTNDRWYIALPLLLASAFFLDTRHRRWRTNVAPVAGSVAAAAGGFALPLAFFESVYAAFFWMGHRAGFDVPFPSYLEQLHNRFTFVTQVKKAGPKLSQVFHSPYPGYLGAMEGWLWFAVIVMALIIVAVRFRREHGVALMWALGPVLLASSSYVAAPRYMSLSVPGLALVVGFAAAMAWDHRERTVRLAAKAFLIVAVASSIWHSPEVFRIRGGWGPAIAAMDARGGGVLIGPKGYEIAADVGLNRVRLGYEESFVWARREIEAGAKWLVLEVWTPPGTELAATAPDLDPLRSTFTVLGPIGELSEYFLHEAQPISSQRFGPHNFLYEGFPPDRDRLVLVYDLTELPG